MVRKTDEGGGPNFDEETILQWRALSSESRAQLLLQGAAHPAESAHEMRCRLKNDLELYDDDDLAALLDKSHDTLARMRVNGKGPIPIRVAREIFYKKNDVLTWITQHRDGGVAA